MQHNNNTKESNTIPAEALAHSYEVFLHQVKTSSKIIYWLVLLFIVGIAAALPYVYLSVDATAVGTLAPAASKQELFAPVSGKISFARLEDNQLVKKGTLIVQIENTVFVQRKSIIEDILIDSKEEMSDLSILLTQGFSKYPNKLPLKSQHYKLDYSQAHRRFVERSAHTKLILNAYNRQVSLYNIGAVSTMKLEQETLLKKDVEDNLLQLQENYKKEWLLAHHQKEETIQNLKSNLVDLNDNIRKSTVKAPISGTLQVPVGITEGVFVTAGSLLARLSPDTLLIAECYVSPSDIGLIKAGQSVRFQISAFNYNEWGFLHGEVSDISHDVILVGDNQPMFKVRCTISHDFLMLKNGYKGYLKKGMSLQGRFLVAERSLYQLLFDKVGDWLNPYEMSDEL